MVYADDTTIPIVIVRPLSRSQVIESGLATINSWCLKWHMKLNPKKTKSPLVSRFRTIAPGYCGFALGGADLEEVKSLRIPRVILDLG